MTDPIVIAPEPPGVRVRCGDADFLFRHVTVEELTTRCADALRAARAQFGGRWRATPEPNLSEDEYDELAAELAVHWLHFHVMNRRRPVVRDEDWDHPRSRRIIFAHTIRRFGEESTDAIRVAAALCGVPVEAFEAWLREDREIRGTF